MSAAARSCRVPPGLSSRSRLPRAAAASATTVAAESVDAYLAVAPDGGVTVFAGKVDLGTGARAALRQIVAEELSLSPERIALIEGDTALTPDQGSTGGSAPVSWSAACRYDKRRQRRGHICCRSAPRGSSVRSPTSKHTTARSSSAAAANWPVLARSIGGAAFNVPVDKSAPLRDPDTYTIVGTSLSAPGHSGKADGAPRLRSGPSRRGHVACPRHPAAGNRRQSAQRRRRLRSPKSRRRKLCVSVIFSPLLRRASGTRCVPLRAFKATWSEAATLPGSDALFDAVRATTGGPDRDAAQCRRRDRGARCVAARRSRHPTSGRSSRTPRWGLPARSPIFATAAARYGPRRRARIGCARPSRRLLGLDASKLRLIYMDGSGSYGDQRQR